MELLKKIKFIAVHHSQRKNELFSRQMPDEMLGHSILRKIDSVKRIRDLHIRINKWEDIGYHYLIDKNGKLCKGRSEKFIGAHVLGHNKNSIGICLIGNFDEESPTKKQIQTLIKFLRQKIREFKIPIKNILGHREFLNVIKTCPGKFVDMNEIRAML